MIVTILQAGSTNRIICVNSGMHAAASKATRTLYRHLLRGARTLDARPGLLPLLTLQVPAKHSQLPSVVGSTADGKAGAQQKGLLAPVPLASFDGTASSPSGVAGAEPNLHDAMKVVSDAIEAWLEPSRLHPPGNPLTAPPPMPLYHAARACVRDNLDLGGTGLLALYAAVTVLQHVASVGAKEAHSERNAVPTLPDSITRRLRQLRAGHAVRPHCLMLEHPSVLPGRRALLVYDISRNLPEVHGNEAWTVRTYCINQPFPQSVAALTGMKGLGRFGDLPLFYGGPEHDNLSVIHRIKDVPGAAAIDPEAAEADPDSALYIGGDAQGINALLEAGKARPDDFKVVMGATSFELVPTPVETDAGASASDPAAAPGTAGASPQQPQEETLALPDDDAWWVATGSGVADYALVPAQFDTSGLFRDGHGLGASDRVSGYNHARFWHQNALWAAAVRDVAATLKDAVSAEVEAGDAVAASAEAARADGWHPLLRACAELHPATAHAMAAHLPLPLQVPAVLQTIAKQLQQE